MRKPEFKLSILNGHYLITIKLPEKHSDFFQADDDEYEIDNKTYQIELPSDFVRFIQSGNVGCYVNRNKEYVELLYFDDAVFELHPVELKFKEVS
jgi:hypothetical protein